MRKYVKTLVAATGVAAIALTPGLVHAQSAAVVCPNYVKGPSNIPSERTGKKIQKALEAYNNDQVEEALNLLYEIDTKQTFDRAFTDRFIGNLLAGQEGKGQKALEFLLNAAKPEVLNDVEQANTLRLVADLSMQLQDYKQAIDWYTKWMKFTCKEDADVYTRIAQAYYETKQLDKMIAPADKAIALLEKPNKNPYVLKLTSYYERKMYKETVDVAETLVKLFPAEKQWWVQLGMFYMLVEDYKKGLSTLEMAYNQGYLSKSSEIKTLAQLYSLNDVPYKAAVLQEKYLNNGLIKKDEQSLSSLANSWHQAKDILKAANYYGQAASVNSNPELFRKQGVLLISAERYKDALKALQTALDKGADKLGSIHMAMMEANFYLGDFKEAYAHANEAKKDSSTARSARSWEPYIKEKAKNRGIKI